MRIIHFIFIAFIFLCSCNTYQPIMIIPTPVGIYVIMPIPVQEPVPKSPFYYSTDSLFSLYENNIDSSNTLKKAWDDYSVEITPKGKYLVKIYNHDLGSISAKITFQDKELFYKTGEIIEWADNGNIIYKGFYNNNLKVYEWKYYNIENGKLQHEGKYLNNKMKGAWKEYNDRGQLINEENYLKENDPFINTIENNIFYEKRIRVDTSYLLNTTLVACNNYDSPAVRRNCTRQEFLSWIRKVRVKMIEKKIFGTMRVIAKISIKENGDSAIEFIRSVNDQTKDLVGEEYKKAGFKFNPPDISGNTELNEIIIRI